jgi:hypothetical protein
VLAAGLVGKVRMMPGGKDGFMGLLKVFIKQSV